MAERSALSSRSAAAAVLFGVCAGCAQSAATLPPDYRSVDAVQQIDERAFSQEDLALSCDEVRSERSSLKERVASAKAVIAGDRTQNQVAGYFAALFLAPIIFVDTNEEQVAIIEKSEARLDQLRELETLRC